MSNEKQSGLIQALVPAIILATFHGMLWIVLLGMMLRFVPAFVKIFEDFEVSLPMMTEWAIGWSLFSARYWFLVLPSIAVMCAADLIVLCALYLHPKAAVLRWLWLALMMLVPLSLMAWTVLAVFLPLLSLHTSLS